MLGLEDLSLIVWSSRQVKSLRPQDDLYDRRERLIDLIEDSDSDLLQVVSNDPNPKIQYATSMGRE